MKIFGHPVHIMLIHFPTALLPMDLICSILGYYTGNRSFIDASFFAMAGGVAVGVLAIIAGAFDLIAIAERHTDALKKALVHGGINSAVIIAYGVLAFRAYKNFPELEPDNLMLLATKGSLVAFMMAGNFLGGSLILKYGVGKMDN